MKLPEFQQSLVIKYDAATPDTIRGRSNAGAPVWTTLATVLGLVYPISMKQAVEAGKVGLFSTHAAIIDYDDVYPAYTTTCKGKRLQVEYNGNKYQVLDFTDAGGQHLFVKLTLLEIEAI